MVDTWATVGSGAQIGADVHLAGGVGIGGVLEPPGARPVIVEDGAFIGSRCIVTEGVRIGREAVLAPNVSLTASVPIIDVTGAEPVEHRGCVPPRAVVVPGTRAEGVPRRHLPARLRADHRLPQRVDRPEDVAQRRAARATASAAERPRYGARARPSPPEVPGALRGRVEPDPLGLRERRVRGRRAHRRPRACRPSTW